MEIFESNPKSSKSKINKLNLFGEKDSEEEKNEEEYEEDEEDENGKDEEDENGKKDEEEYEEDEEDSLSFETKQINPKKDGKKIFESIQNEESSEKQESEEQKLEKKMVEKEKQKVGMEGKMRSIQQSKKYLPPHLKNEEGSKNEKKEEVKKYLPPHLKNSLKNGEEKEKMEIARRVRRLMNKIGKENSVFTAKSIMDLYNDFAKNHVNSILLEQLLKEAIPSNLFQSSSRIEKRGEEAEEGMQQEVENAKKMKNEMVSNLILYYSFIFCYLYRFNQDGVNFLSFVVEEVFREFEKYCGENNFEIANNLMKIILNLYLFKAISSSLVFDLIRYLLQDVNVLRVQLLFILLKMIAPLLKKDDPSALSQIIKSLQILNNKSNQTANNKKREELLEDERERSTLLKKKNEKSTTKDPKREEEEEEEKKKKLKLILEMIYEIKNNKKGEKENSLSSHLVSLLFSKNTQEKDLFHQSPLNISWSDLKQIESKGRWWLVGSAWSNNNLFNQNYNQLYNQSSSPSLLDSRASEKKSALKNSGGNTKKRAKEEEDEIENKALLEIAKKHKMNTPLRKTLFMVMVNSCDYLECFEKILKLGMKGKEERELVYVIGYCCSSEKNYNKFYSLLAQKLCAFNKQFSITFKYFFYDKMKDLENQAEYKIFNLAQLLLDLVETSHLSLNVFAQINFLDSIPKNLVSFLNYFFANLFADLKVFPESNLISIFQKLKGTNEKESFLMEGLSLFFLTCLKFSTKFGVDTSQKQLIKDRIKLANSILRSNNSNTF